MNPQDYASMFLAVPTEQGLETIGHAFLQECLRGAQPLTTAEEINNFAQQQQQKWGQFCDLVEGSGIQPNRDAYAALSQILLSRKGMRF